MLYKSYVARLVRAIQEISRYRGQAAVRRHFREFKKMKCQQTLGIEQKLTDNAFTENDNLMDLSDAVGQVHER